HQSFRLAYRKPAGPDFDGMVSHRNVGEAKFAGGVDLGGFLVLAVQVLDADLAAGDACPADILNDSHQRTGSGLRVQSDQSDGQDEGTAQDSDGGGEATVEGRA